MMSFLERLTETDRRPSPGMLSEVRATEELAESCPPKIEKLQTSGLLNGVPNVEAFLSWRTTKELEAKRELLATEELAESCPPKSKKLQTSGLLNGVPNVEAFLIWRTTRELSGRRRGGGAV